VSAEKNDLHLTTFSRILRSVQALYSCLADHLAISEVMDPQHVLSSYSSAKEKLRHCILGSKLSMGVTNETESAGKKVDMFDNSPAPTDPFV
jgi:hypothetical protein